MFFQTIIVTKCKHIQSDYCIIIIINLNPVTDDTVFPQLVEPSFLRQAYAVLEAAGTDGVSNSKMMKRLTIDGLEVRMIIRTMERRGLITSLMTEVGKQKKKV